MNKPANNEYPIHELLKKRWSPRSFDSRPVETEKLYSLFEAARWSPSGGNMQPWAFILTTKADPEPFQRLLSALGERNQLWARHAPVLVLSIYKRERDAGKPNPWAAYDLGQAVAHLSVEAGDLGLAVHQMGGFDAQKARQLFDLPEGYDPMTVIAIGYPGEPEDLPEGLRQRESEARTRKPLEQFVFAGAWLTPLSQAVKEGLN